MAQISPSPNFAPASPAVATVPASRNPPVAVTMPRAIDSHCFFMNCRFQKRLTGTIENLELTVPVAGTAQAGSVNDLYSRVIQGEQLVQRARIHRAWSGQCLVSTIQFTLEIHEAGWRVGIWNFVFMRVSQRCCSSSERGTGIACRSRECRFRYTAAGQY